MRSEAQNVNKNLIFTKLNDDEVIASVKEAGDFALPCVYQSWFPDPRLYGLYYFYLPQDQTPQSSHMPPALSKKETQQLSVAVSQWANFSDEKKEEQAGKIRRYREQDSGSLITAPYSMVEVEEQLYLVTRRTLGQGSSKRVKLAFPVQSKQHLTLGPAVALCMIDEDSARVAELNDNNYAVEKKMMEHVYGVRLRSQRRFGASDGRLNKKVIVQPLVPGRPLDSFCYEERKLTSESTPEEKAKLWCKSNQFRQDIPLYKRFDIAISAMRALQFIHSKNVLHVDIKPGNILYDEGTGQSRFIDFSFAKHDPEMKGVEGDFEGTLLYMSPDVIQNNGLFYTRQTDLFSMGELIFQLFVKSVPPKMQLALHCRLSNMGAQASAESLRESLRKLDEANLDIEFHADDEAQEASLRNVIGRLKNMNFRNVAESLEELIGELEMQRAKSDVILEDKPLENFEVCEKIPSLERQVYNDMFLNNRYAKVDYSVWQFIGFTPGHEKCTGFFNRTFFHLHNGLFVLKLLHNLVLYFTVYQLKRVCDFAFSSGDLLKQAFATLPFIFYALLFPIIRPTFAMEKAADKHPALAMLCGLYILSAYVGILFAAQSAVIALGVLSMTPAVFAAVCESLSFLGAAATFVVSLMPITVLGFMKAIHAYILGRSVELKSNENVSGKASDFGVWKRTGSFVKISDSTEERILLNMDTGSSPV